ncbi:MAG: hypothetical protein ACRCU1_14770 [Alsobacter sp.]
MADATTLDAPPLKATLGEALNSYRHQLQHAQNALRYAWLYVDPLTPPKDERALDLCEQITQAQIDIAINALNAARPFVRGAIMKGRAP